jgi:hypothetical protein
VITALTRPGGSGPKPLRGSAEAPSARRWENKPWEGDSILAAIKKEKKEKKFNSERVGRTVKTALKAVFPNETFIVSTLVEKVEVLYPGTTKTTPAEINTFRAVFCTLSKIKKEELAFSLYDKKAV